MFPPISICQFFEIYRELIDIALHSAEPKLILNAEQTVRSARYYIAMQNSGQQFAQRQICQLVTAIPGWQHWESDFRDYAVLLLRRLVDAIAFRMFFGETHLMRRTRYHKRIPSIPTELLAAYLDYTEELLAESNGLKFGLIADLTTFLHVSDILVVDCTGIPSISLHELKSGEVNLRLMEHLFDEQGRARSGDEEELLQSLLEKEKKQALRMLRQHKRNEQVLRFFQTEKGVDLYSNSMIDLSGPRYIVDHYYAEVQDLCNHAMKNGLATLVIDDCLHLAAAFDDEPESRAKLAVYGSFISFRQKERSVLFNGIAAAVYKEIPAGSHLELWDVFQTNLTAMGTTPFPLWLIDTHCKAFLAGTRLKVFVGLDIAAFIWLGTKMDLSVRITDRRQSELVKQAFKQKGLWSNRTIIVNGRLVSNNVIMQIVTDLVCPRSVLMACGKRNQSDTNLILN